MGAPDYVKHAFEHNPEAFRRMHAAGVQTRKLKAELKKAREAKLREEALLAEKAAHEARIYEEVSAQVDRIHAEEDFYEEGLAQREAERLYDEAKAEDLDEPEAEAA